MKRSDLLHLLTGTPHPLRLSDRESLIIDKCLEVINGKEQSNELLKSETIAPLVKALQDSLQMVKNLEVYTTDSVKPIPEWNEKMNTILDNNRHYLSHLSKQPTNERSNS